MVNTNSRSPGQVQRFDAAARISDAPSFAVDTGEAGRAMAAVGAQLSIRLGQMADKAAAREGAMAGLSAGQRAGAGYLQHQAVTVPAGDGGYDLSGHVPKGREGHLAGIRPEFRNALSALFAAAPEEIRSQLTLNSGYRSEERQAELYQEALGKYGSEALARKWVAPPGKSRHNHGDAYDLQYGSDAARAWVHENAGRFGLAFPMGHEPWHIELVTARGGSAAAGAAELAANSHAGEPLSTTPLALRNDGTIRGEAFDAAARQAFSWRFQAGLTTDLGQAYDDHKDDPAAYAAAANKVVEKYAQDPIIAGDPQSREAFDKLVYEKTEAARLDIAARQEARLRNAEIASMNEGLAAQQSDLERQAYALGGNPAADDMLAPQLQRAESAIAAALEDGLLTPAQAASQRETLLQTVSNARVQGTFAALPTPGQKEAFALGLMEEWEAGGLPQYSLSQVQALSNTLYSKARAEANQQTAAQKAEAAQLSGLIADDLTSMAATGQGLDFNQTGLDPAKVGALLGEEALASWQASRDLARDTWLATSGMELESPQEVADRLAALEPQEGQAGFARQAEIYAAAQKRAQALMDERATDPMGQAHRGGLVELKPIEPGNLDSLIQRRDQARQVSAVYGTPVTVFRQSEREAITAALYGQPEFLPEFAQAVSSSFGELAPVALSELSEAGPELAFAAGLTSELGDNGVMGEISRVLVGRRDKTISVKMPADGVMANAGGAVLGNALMGNPKTRAAALNVAAILFEGQAAAMGFDPADVKDETSPAFAQWQRAVNRALGARQVNGEQYGGLTQVNGMPTVAPPSMKASELQGLVSSISAADLAALPPITSGNGVTVQPWQLQGAKLVAVGNGSYRVALGDPNGLEPQFLQGGDGQPWLLDVEALRAVQAARPDQGNFNPFQTPALWRRPASGEQ